MTMKDVRKLMPLERVEQLIAEGLTLRDVEKLLGATGDQVRCIEKESGLKFARDSKLGTAKRRAIFSPENFLLWQKQGLTRSDIARETGYSSQTVGMYLKRFPEINIRHSKKYNIILGQESRIERKVTRVKCKAAKKVVRPERKIDEVLFMPWVSDSQPLKPDHGIAA